MDFNIDSIIKNSLNNENNVPKELGEVIIKKTQQLNKNKIKYKKISKFIASMSACLIITGGIVFAKDISDFFKNTFNLDKMGISDNKINSSIENGYIQNVSMDYIKTEDLDLKVNNIMMDDINLIISMEAIAKCDVSEFSGLSISELYITDNLGNQIFLDSEDQKLREKSFAETARWSMTKKDNNKMDITLILTSTKFPKSEEIYMSFGRMAMYTIQDSKPNIKELKSNYNLTLKINETFVNRETTYYETKAIKAKNTEIKQVTLSQTGLGIWTKVAGEVNLEYKLVDKSGNDWSDKLNLNVVIDYNSPNQSYFAWFDIEDYGENLDEMTLKIDVKTISSNPIIISSEEYKLINM